MVAPFRDEDVFEAVRAANAAGKVVTSIAFDRDGFHLLTEEAPPPPPPPPIIAERPRTPWPREERVYFVEALGFVKIGRSVDVDSRLKSFATSLPVEPKLLGTVPGGLDDQGRSVEAVFHERFAHLRVRGEWFRHEGELAVFTATLRADNG